MQFTDVWTKRTFDRFSRDSDATKNAFSNEAFSSKVRISLEPRLINLSSIFKKKFGSKSSSATS